MKLYIDEANIESFVKSKNSRPEEFLEVKLMIKKGFDVHHNFPKDELLKNNYVTAWLKEIKGQGVERDTAYCPNSEITPKSSEDNDDTSKDYHNMRSVKSNFYVDYDLEGLSSIFLLNIDDNTAQTLKDKGSVLVGKCGEELDLLSRFASLDDKNTPVKDIKAWSDYCPELPLTDLIICDNYYFNSKKAYEQDNHEFLRAISKYVGSQINLVIIAKKGEIDSNFDLNIEAESIRNILSTATGLSKKKCNVTIMTSYREHNRHAITNYYRIDCSPGFIIHSPERRVKNNDTADIKPHIIRSAYLTSQSLIEEYQEVVNSKPDIYGSPKSNFLQFNEE